MLETPPAILVVSNSLRNRSKKWWDRGIMCEVNRGGSSLRMDWVTLRAYRTTEEAPKTGARRISMPNFQTTIYFSGVYIIAYISDSITSTRELIDYQKVCLNTSVNF